MEKKYKFQDEAFSFQERAKDLVDQMTIEEAASQMLFEAAKIERLGVQAFNWWNEALHGAARSGMATVFPQSNESITCDWSSDVVLFRSSGPPM